MDKYRVLITGGAGYIGSNLARACLQLGWDVSVPYQPELGLGQIENIKESLHLFPIHNAPEEIHQMFTETRPEVVFHLASLFLVTHEPGDIPSLVSSNLSFGTLILEAMTHCGVQFLVNTGTSWQHYEDQAYSPVNLYAATKQAFEDIVTYYLATSPLRVVTLKLFDTYGPGDPRPKLFPLIQKSIDKDQPLNMSPGEQIVDFVFIEDVVQAYLVAAQRLLNGKVRKYEEYAVTSGEPLQLKDLVAKIQEVTGWNVPVHWGGRPYREREVMVPWRKGKRLPGWQPKVNLEEGIKKTYQDND